jgi:hypothetical protein
MVDAIEDGRIVEIYEMKSESDIAEKVDFWTGV